MAPAHKTRHDEGKADARQASGAHGKVLAEWTFPEYEHHDRSRGWFLTAGIVGGGMLVWALVSGNYLFALIIIMVALVIMTHHYNKPSQVEFQITQEGLQLGEHFYPFSDIARFWIIYQPPDIKKLYFRFKTKLHPSLHVPLVDRNPLHVRSILLTYLTEDLRQEQEPTADTLGRRWKLS